MIQQKYIEKNSILVDRCKNGDQRAQYEIYKLYKKAMFNTCLRFLNHEAEAEDVLQDAFVDAFAKIHSYRQEASFGLWLKQIVVNKAINKLRTRKLQFVDLEQGTEIADTSTYPLDEEEISMDVQRIKHALGLLPDGYRAVVNLYLFEGYDHEEISSILGISESTSRTQFMRGKKKLLELLR